MGFNSGFKGLIPESNLVEAEIVVKKIKALS